MKRLAIEVRMSPISGAKMGGRDRKPKFVPSIESLECEGLISLEEVDPSCVLLNSSQKDNKVQNGWTVKGISEPSNENVKGSKKQRSSLLLPLLKQKAKKRGKFEEEEITKKKKQDSGLESDVDMKHWSSYQLNPLLMKGLQSVGFTEPTPIQERSLVEAINNRRDIFGVAKTGSGKTIAYGLPILNQIAQDRMEELGESSDVQLLQRKGIYALILVPTRELGMQVVTHLKQVARFIPKIKIISIIGGMSVEKQQRELSINPDIVVATPGRLWELMESGGETEQFSASLARIKFFVVDEADRMIENGHFKEFDLILGFLYFQNNSLNNSLKPTKKDKTSKPKITFQTFIFSATLSLKREVGAGTVIDPMADLLKRLAFRGGKSPFYIDLVSESATIVPETLSEYKIAIPEDEKDLFLAYLLLVNQHYSLGKVLVFLNTIDGIRRLVPFLKNLGVFVLPLHSQMQQRQRLNNIDKFTSNPNGVLVASDVAARGLDIPQVSTVIHYQLPHQPELYVHRSGRTARANGSGISVALVGELDLAQSKRLISKLNSSTISKFPGIDLNIVYQLKRLVRLSKELDSIEHGVGKARANNNWIQEAADMLGVEVDASMVKNAGNEKDLKHTTQHLKQQLELEMKKITGLMERSSLQHPLLSSKFVKSE